MPRKKKAPYEFFMVEQGQTQPVLFGKSKGELADLCRQLWEAMGDLERQPYQQMAQDHNNNLFAVNTMVNTDQLDGRFDCYGRSLKALKQKEELEKYHREVMLRDIRGRLERAKRRQTLPTARFHILHVNLWLGPEDAPSGQCLPCELGLVEMSLQQGLHVIYNQLIDPGPPPIGYKGEMRVYSEKYHKIWLDNDELSDDYAGIVAGILDLLRVRPEKREYAAGERAEGVKNDFEAIRQLIDYEEEKKVKEGVERNFLPVYVMPKMKESCQGAMDWLQKKAGTTADLQFYELHYLFRQLLEMAPLNFSLKIPTLNISEAHLSRDVFHYTSGLSCQYHESLENCLCAGADACRKAYIICDFTGQLFGIEPVEGRHYPWGVRGYDADATGSADDNEELLAASVGLDCSFGGGAEVGGGDAGSICGTGDISFGLPPRTASDRTTFSSFASSAAASAVATTAKQHKHILDGFYDVSDDGVCHWKTPDEILATLHAGNTLSLDSFHSFMSASNIPEEFVGSFHTPEGSEFAETIGIED